MLAGNVAHFELAEESVFASMASRVVRCPRTGVCTAPQRVLEATEELMDFVVADARIVYVERDGFGGIATTFLRALPVAGGPSVLLDQIDGGQSEALAVGPTHLVWAMWRGNQEFGELRGIARAGGAAFAIDKPEVGGAFHAPLAVGPDFAVYHRTTDDDTQRLMAVPLTSAAVPTGNLTVADVTRIRVIEGSVWFTTSTSEIAYVDPTLVNRTVVSNEPAGVRDFSVQDGALYTLNTTTREIRRCQVESCANTGELLPVDRPGLRQLETDATHVYFTATGGLYRIPR